MKKATKKSLLMLLLTGISLMTAPAIAQNAKPQTFLNFTTEGVNGEEALQALEAEFLHTVISEARRQNVCVRDLYFSPNSERGGGAIEAVVGEYANSIVTLIYSSPKQIKVQNTIALVYHAASILNAPEKAARKARMKRAYAMFGKQLIEQQLVCPGRDVGYGPQRGSTFDSVENGYESGSEVFPSHSR